MSWLTKFFTGAVDDFKRRAREWCRNPAATNVIVAYPPLQLWMSQQPEDVQAKVKVAIPLVLEAIADKWFGG